MSEKNEGKQTGIGYQEECPECGVDLGNPKMDAGSIERIKGRHIGSDRCKETRAHVQKMLGRMAVDGTGGLDSDTAESPDQRKEKARPARETVVFSSVAPNLKLLLVKEKKHRDSAGDVVDVDPAVWAEFREGRYVTDNPKIIELMRRHSSNHKIIVRRHGEEGARNRPDVFFERTAVPHKLESDGERIAASA